MTSRRIALWASIAAATFWTAKSIAISLAGGLDKSPLEAPLFFLGLISFVVAVVALGVALTPGRHALVRVAAGVGGFVVGFVLTLLVDAVVGSFETAGAERHWVWTEFNLWVVALAALTLAVAVARPREESTDPELVLHA